MAKLAPFHRLLITETQEDCRFSPANHPFRSGVRGSGGPGGRSGRTQLRLDHSDRSTNWKYRHYPARSTGCRLSPTSILRLTGRYLIVRRLEMQQRCWNKTKLLLYTHTTAPQHCLPPGLVIAQCSILRLGKIELL